MPRQTNISEYGTNTYDNFNFSEEHFKKISLCRTCIYGEDIYHIEGQTGYPDEHCRKVNVLADDAHRIYYMDTGAGVIIDRCAFYKYREHAVLEYYDSNNWIVKRNECIKRAGYQCEMCKSAKNLHVHHITYERVPFELEDDLLCLCKKCHNKIHEHDFTK